MSEASSASTARQGDVLRFLAEALAPYLREQFRNSVEHQTGFYSQHNSPLGRRKHLDMVRSGVLPGHRVGRDVLVRRELVDAFIETREAARREPPIGQDPLADWGVTPKRTP
jgi:excisionase family DNA binding protein